MRQAIASAAAILALALAVTGCAAPGPPAASQIPPEDTCAELSDVGTLVANLQFAETEGRLVGNEYNGAMRLAARMLGRIAVEPGTELAEVVTQLQAVAPAGQIGASTGAVDPTAVEWYETWALVQDACNDAMGVTEVLDGFGVEGWVGG